ncbi:MAG TPA: hypothetical protein VLR90_05135 [Blastocatellia bacterium]|nr:hypothetical protein [Blastocatellia bacterium]
MAASLINTECKRYGCIKNLLACYANCRYSGRCDELKNEILDKTDQAAKDINSYLGERGRKPIMIQIMKRGVKFTDIANVKNVIPAKAERKEPIRLKRKKSRNRAKPKSSPTFSAVESSVVNIRKTRAASYLEKTQALSTQKTARKRKPARKRKESAKPGNTITTKAARNSFKLNQRESITMPKRAINKSIESPVEKESVSNITSGDLSTSANSRTKTRRKSSSKSRSASRNGKVYIILEGKTANIVDEKGLMQHLFTNPSAGARYFEASEVEARINIVLKK